MATLVRKNGKTFWNFTLCTWGDQRMGSKFWKFVAVSFLDGPFAVLNIRKHTIYTWPLIPFSSGRFILSHNSLIGQNETADCATDALQSDTVSGVSGIAFLYKWFFFCWEWILLFTLPWYLYISFSLVLGQNHLNIPLKYKPKTGLRKWFNEKNEVIFQNWM